MKNKSIIYLIIPILLLACSNAENKKNSSVIHFDSGYSLHQDTITVNIKGEMTHALKYQDKYYALFKQRVLTYGGYGKRWLYIFSNGQVERIVDCPKEMKTVYLDFYAKNDSLILKPYMDKQNYYLNLENHNWIKIDKTDDLIFEGDSFQVFSLDFGEWGGKTWFKGKNTGQEYVLEATTPLVNKIDSIYYLTNSFQVIKIKNPRLLNKCTDDVTYENIESTGKSYFWYGEPKGFVYVYQDTTFNYFDFNYQPRIVSSFVLNKKLLHIYETDTATYIASHKGYSIIPIQKIADNISFYNWHYSYRCSNLNGNNELLKFSTKNDETFGLLEMVDHEIHVTYFKNKALLEPKFLGTERADSIFVKRLNAILLELNNLKLKVADSIEQTCGSFDVTPNHKIGIGDCWNPNKYVIDTCRAFLIKEDSIISNSIMYYATKDKDLVRAVTINWNDETNIFSSISEEKSKKTFDRKINFLNEQITQEAGEYSKRIDKDNYYELTWEMPKGITVELERMKKHNSIRLIIYKQLDNMPNAQQ